MLKELDSLDGGHSKRRDSSVKPKAITPARVAGGSVRQGRESSEDVAEVRVPCPPPCSKS